MLQLVKKKVTPILEIFEKKKLLKIFYKKFAIFVRSQIPRHLEKLSPIQKGWNDLICKKKGIS